MCLVLDLTNPQHLLRQAVQIGDVEVALQTRGYQAADAPRRPSRATEPLFDQGMPVAGKKKYYN